MTDCTRPSRSLEVVQLAAVRLATLLRPVWGAAGRPMSAGPAGRVTAPSRRPDPARVSEREIQLAWRHEAPGHEPW